MLWSARSQRAAWLAGKMGDFEKAEAAAYQGLVEAGYDPFFLADLDLLQARGVRAVVLPMTLSLGKAQRAALQAFAKGGGLVLATHPAAFDEFLRPAGPLDVAKPFPGNPDELQRALEAAGLKPEVGARDVDGKRVPSVTVSCHAFPGVKDAELILVLRTPVGQKEVLGADGVPRSVPDPSGGPPVQRIQLDVSRLAGRKFFDVRRRQTLTPKDGLLAIDMEAGDGRPIAALPYDAPKLAMTATREGDRLRVKISAKSVSVPHALRLEVGGDPLLSRNLVVDAKGEVDLEIPLAIEERARSFDLRATDILTGVSAVLK